MPLEHSAILLTFIKLPFSINTFVMSIFEWQLKTGFTVFAVCTCQFVPYAGFLAHLYALNTCGISKSVSASTPTIRALW